MTLDELVSEEKKLDSQKISIAVLMGFLVGVAVWLATHEGSALTYILLFFVILIANIYSRKLKSIQAEISRRNTIS